jgi:hypothetical protein
MKTNFTNYTEKLKELATNLRGIEHSDNANKRNFGVICTAAYVNQLGQVNIDEVLKGVKTLLATPCLLADLPIINTDDPKGQNIKNVYAGAFLILTKSPKDKLGDQLEDMSQCLKLAQNALGWLKEKFIVAEEEGTAYNEWNIIWEDVDIQPIAKLMDNWVGVRVNLPFKEENEVAYEYDATAFVTPM